MASGTRLIDAEAMREYWLENGENEYVYDTNAVLDSIDEQPTVDAVEVVRCKDCKHYDGKWHCWRNYKPGMRGADMVDEEDFCSYGERRTK